MNSKVRRLNQIYRTLDELHKQVKEPIDSTIILDVKDIWSRESKDFKDLRNRISKTSSLLSKEKRKKYNDIADALEKNQSSILNDPPPKVNYNFHKKPYIQKKDEVLGKIEEISSKIKAQKDIHLLFDEYRNLMNKISKIIEIYDLLQNKDAEFLGQHKQKYLNLANRKDSIFQIDLRKSNKDELIVAKANVLGIIDEIEKLEIEYVELVEKHNRLITETTIFPELPNAFELIKDSWDLFQKQLNSQLTLVSEKISDSELKDLKTKTNSFIRELENKISDLARTENRYIGKPRMLKIDSSLIQKLEEAEWLAKVIDSKEDQIHNIYASISNFKSEYLNSPLISVNPESIECNQIERLLNQNTEVIRKYYNDYHILLVDSLGSYHAAKAYINIVDTIKNKIDNLERKLININQSNKINSRFFQLKMWIVDKKQLKETIRYFCEDQNRKIITQYYETTNSKLLAVLLKIRDCITKYYVNYSTIPNLQGSNINEVEENIGLIQNIIEKDTYLKSLSEFDDITFYSLSEFNLLREIRLRYENFSTAIILLEQFKQTAEISIAESNKINELIKKWGNLLAITPKWKKNDRNLNSISIGSREFSIDSISTLSSSYVGSGNELLKKLEFLKSVDFNDDVALLNGKIYNINYKLRVFFFGLITIAIILASLTSILIRRYNDNKKLRLLTNFKDKENSLNDLLKTVLDIEEKIYIRLKAVELIFLLGLNTQKGFTKIQASLSEMENRKERKEKKVFVVLNGLAIDIERRIHRNV